MVCSDPNKPVNKLVFCHKVMVELVMVRMIKCKLGNQAANAITIKATAIATAKYFGLVITFATVTIIDYWSIGSITAWKAAYG